MEFIRILLLLCAICLLTPSVVSAQNGAFVFKGEDQWWFLEWAGTNVVSIHSHNSELFCDTGEDMWGNWMEVWRPDGTIKYHDRGFYFTRVFYVDWDEDDLDDFFNDPCAFWPPGPLVAEGITHTTYNDNDIDFGLHPHRTNSWGYTINGMLEDIEGLCPGDMVKLHVLFRGKIKGSADWPACWPGCVITRYTGPQLICPD